MIRCIAAMDARRGIANEHGIPWDLPSDRKYFREQTAGGTVLMGYKTYLEFAEALPGRQNVVASARSQPLRPGFELTTDALLFLQQARTDVWIIGGAGLFAVTIKLADELYLTEIERDFACTKFFPEFNESFVQVKRSERMSENGITFYFVRYRRKTS